MKTLTARIWQGDVLLDNLPPEEYKRIGREMNERSMKALGYIKVIPQKSRNSSKG